MGNQVHKGKAAFQLPRVLATHPLCGFGKFLSIWLPHCHSLCNARMMAPTLKAGLMAVKPWDVLGMRKHWLARVAAKVS